MFLVTGGGSGIGRALAQALAMRGKDVLVVGRRQAPLEETASFSSLISFYCADIATEFGRDALVKHLEKTAVLEGLIHNAGSIEPMMPMKDIPEKAWQDTMAVNLNAPLFLSQKLLSRLKGGRVLHIGSGVAYYPTAGWAAYCVSKAALSMLTRCWQLESKETAFASVMPGITETAMQDVIRQGTGMEKERLAFFTRLFQENRLIRPNTVALFLTWLLLDLPTAEYVSQEWDIYNKAHHPFWLIAPHEVPEWGAL